MDTRRFGEASVLHLEPDTYAKLLQLAATGPGRPGGGQGDAAYLATAVAAADDGQPWPGWRFGY